MKAVEHRGGQRNNFRRRGPMDKKNMVCEHCHRTGHNKDTCFKLHGVPDWYKDLHDQKRKPVFGRAYAANELQTSVDQSTAPGNNLVSELMEALKIVQNRMPQDPVHVYFAHIDEMADPSYSPTFVSTPLASSTTPPSSDTHVSPTTVPPTVATDSSIAVRRSTRVSKPPAWLDDFHCNLSHTSTLSSNDLSLSQKGFLVALSTIREPSFNWPVHQVDINNAFLHGFLDEDIYMTVPKGSSIPPGKVCKLRRSLYGLKQTSRQWNLEFTAQLLSGFTQSHHDHCLFVKDSSDGLVALLVYVDDVLITSPSMAKITEVKRFLDAAFTIEDLGSAKYFLGLVIARSAQGMSITQHKFIQDIISDSGLQSSKPAATPLPMGIKLSSFSPSPLSDVEPYRGLVGRLLYLSFTRPDISFAAQQLSQFVHAPCSGHMSAALHLVRYLKGCPHLGLFFPFSSFGPLISWKTKKQPTIARSTTEAEYRSLGATACELRWISFLLQDFRLPFSVPIPLYCDNQAATHIVANPMFHERTKYLEIDCHLVRDLYKTGFLFPSHISGQAQLADMFTKLLPRVASLSKLDLVSFPQAHLEAGMKNPLSSSSPATAVDIHQKFVHKQRLA
ncbi:UNVERIFIED_CONTAM: Retrovirus-related Pol polyprotein from transposon RE1 [Sesamum radiatum]|uniref:Retrovirus-related Pol polyprotein from transposon RE1 n=1 Tax=Sesamum radiatum TaxID=300843 RepID=A0AAW2LQC1_SESRA